MTVRRAHGFGTGFCGFSGFQPYKTANFKAAFPKLKLWKSLNKIFDPVKTGRILVAGSTSSPNLCTAGGYYTV
jgi:hypothetical protein